MAAARREQDGLQPELRYMDWMFSPQSVWCAGGIEKDLSTYSIEFRVFVCVFALLALIWPLYLHKKRGDGFMLSSTQIAAMGLVPPPKPKRERLYHLDYFRTMAVTAVMVDHSGGDRITEHNTYGSLQWTQQFLMLISGMAFMMSRSNMVPYVLRLLLITVIGMIANWLGFFIAGGMRVRPKTICVQCFKMDDPAHDQRIEKRDAFSVFYRDPNADPSCSPHCEPDYNFTDISFQMGYALMLAAIAILCRPVKEAVQWRNDNPREHAPMRIQLIAAGYGFLFLLQLGAYVAEPTEGKFYSPCGYTLVMLQLAIICLVCVYPINDGYGAESAVGWILACVMYIPRVVGDVQFKPGHWIDMFVLGLVVHHWPLLGHKQVLKTFKAYFPIALALLILAKVDQSGRCDLHVPFYWFERMRFNFGEAWLVVAFCVGALNAQDPWGISRWLNWWSLYGFCFHRMWFMILPIPYGFAFTCSHMSIFYILNKMYPPEAKVVLAATTDDLEISSSGTTSRGSINPSDDTTARVGDEERTASGALRKPLLEPPGGLGSESSAEMKPDYIRLWAGQSDGSE